MTTDFFIIPFTHLFIMKYSMDVEKHYRQKKNVYLCGSTHTLTKHWGDSAFNPLTVPLGWLSSLWMTQLRLIHLSTHVVFLIQIENLLLIRVASWWVYGWDHTIKKAKKSCWQQTENRTCLCNDNKIKSQKMSFKKWYIYSPIPEVGSL